MTHFRSTFMGNVGFEEIKRYSRQGIEFGREIVNTLNERAVLEQNYAKGLRRLGQRLSRATAGVVGSPLSNAWKTVGVEMEKEAEVHRELGARLIDDCVQPLSRLTEGQVKPRRMAEQNVEMGQKTLNERNVEHTKTKRRLHTVMRENESLLDQISGPRPKTERDQQKLIIKQQKTEESLHRTDSEYYNSLIQLERARQSWETWNFECCDAIEDMEDNRFRALCDVIQKYTDNLYEIPSKTKTACRIIDEATENLSSQKEILVVAEKLKGVQYMSEQLLCDYYQENFSCQMSIDRRRASVNSLLNRYISDCQKERSRKDGLERLGNASGGEVPNQVEIQNKLKQSKAMLTFLDMIRYKLNCTLASLDGKPRPSHPLANNLEQHTDKQGIMYSLLRLRPGEADEKMREADEKMREADRDYDKSTSRNRSRPSKSRAPTRHRSSSFEERARTDDQPHHRHKKHFETVSAATGSHVERKKSDTPSSSSLRSPHPHPPTPPLETSGHGASSNVGADGSAVICTCVAVYDYIPTRDDELAIHQGDVIKVFEKGEDDWWRGEAAGKIGLFPANYVDVEINV